MPASRPALLCCLALLTAACSRPTTVESTWHTAEPGRGYARVLVVGLGEDLDRRRLFEDRLRDDLVAAGVTAWSSSREMPLSAALSAETLRPVVAATGADAVIVARLVRRDVEATEIEARTGVKIRRRDDYAYDLFRYRYQEYQEPAYLEVTATVGVATDLYDAGSAALVYSIETVSYEKSNVYEILDELTPAITRRLRRDGVLR